MESIKFIEFEYNFPPTQLTSIMDLHYYVELLSSKIDYQTPAILPNLSSEVFCALFVESMQHCHKRGNSELQTKCLALLYQFSMSHNINISNHIIYRNCTFYVAGMYTCSRAFRFLLGIRKGFIVVTDEGSFGCNWKFCSHHSTSCAWVFVKSNFQKMVFKLSL